VVTVEGSAEGAGTVERRVTQAVTGLSGGEGRDGVTRKPTTRLAMGGTYWPGGWKEVGRDRLQQGDAKEVGRDWCSVQPHLVRASPQVH
jgi:hypothetical protein